MGCTSTWQLLRDALRHAKKARQSFKRIKKNAQALRNWGILCCIRKWRQEAKQSVGLCAFSELARSSAASGGQSSFNHLLMQIVEIKQVDETKNTKDKV